MGIIFLQATARDSRKDGKYMKHYFLTEFGNVSKRVLSFLLALIMVLGMCPVVRAAEGTALYLKPNDNWLQSDARFAVYCWDNGGGSTWVDATDEDGDGYYEAVIPEGYTNIIFCRMNPGAAENDWNNKWNQTADLTVPTDGSNCYSVAEGTWDNGDGEWSELVFGTRLYVKPNDNWHMDSARFAAYCFEGGDSVWVDAVDEDGDGYYEVLVPEGYTNIIFCRMNPGVAENDWNNKWNQTADLKVPTDGTNCYTVAENTWDNGGGEWSVYPPEQEPDEPTQPPVSTDKYVVAGVSGLCGSEWNGTDENNRMTHMGDGIFSAVFTDVAVGTNYEFKVVKNGAEWIGDSTGSNILFDVTEICDVTVTYNSADNTITVTGEGVSLPQIQEKLEYSTVHVVGSFPQSDWVVSAITMEKEDQDVYVYTLENLSAGNYEFKFATDKAWTHNWGAGAQGEAVYNGQNISLKLTEDSDVTFRIDLTGYNHAAKTGAVYSVEILPCEQTPTEPSDPTDPVDPPVDGTTVTLRFYKPEGWGDTVRAWIWGPGGAIPGYEQFQTAWPGSPIEADAEHPGWYTVAVTTEAPMAFSFIFNDGVSQTADLSTGEITGDTELWVVGNNVYTEKPVPKVSIHFLKPEGWNSSVHAYAWGGVDLGAWPGTAVSENASNAGWYDLNVEAGSNEGFSFIFNDNSGNQTGDLTTGALGMTTELWVTVDGRVSSEAPAGWDDPNRTVHVPGTFPGPSWDAASNKMYFDTELELYVYTFENVPAANYEFKIAINGTWDENYGAGGSANGANIAVSVPETMDVTVYYNDSTHLAVTNVTYKFVEASVSGSGFETASMTDKGLTGIYSATVELAAGTYSDVVITCEGEAYAFAQFTVDETKAVTFYIDPVTGLFYNNASDVPVDSGSIFYDSQDEAYKAPFGAVAAGEEVAFSIRTGEDVTSAVLVIKGVKSYPMEKGEGNVWSATASIDRPGEYDYYFALSNGSAVAVYGDDDGYYSPGCVTDLVSVQPYDLVVYHADFETPEWMKNAVIYQIFPDRFFDGDPSNNQAQTWARGDVDYEFITDWYTLPENPEQEALLSEEEYKATGAHWGDGQWSNEIYGGDLQGIIQRIDYLKALGVNVIYLNPVFWSISNHRYDAVDYTEIDPILGTLGDFEELVKVAEENDMHIILDGVFNHVSDDSVYFDRYYKFLPDAAEKYDGKIGAYPYWAYVYDLVNGGMAQTEAEAAAKAHFAEEYGITDFSYTEWFEVKNEKGTNGVYVYEGWWGYDSMPVIKSTNGSEFQTGNWAEEIIYNEDGTSVTQYWISKGNNGWRLDVANEVSDETWREFRNSVKALDSEAVIIGEIWDDATKYLMGDMYDSVMNYQFRNAVTSFVLGETSENTAKALEKIRERYPEEAFYAMMNLVGSHDTTRIRSYLDGIGDDRSDKTLEGAFPSKENTKGYTSGLQRNVALLQFTYPGAPTIYYGDEIGMLGADDPDDRRAFEWGRGAKGMVEWYAMLAAIRAAYPALRTGDIEMVDSGYEEVLAFWRTDADSEILVLANSNYEGEGERAIVYQMPADKLGVWVDALSGIKFYLDETDNTVVLGASWSVILVPEDQYQEIHVNYEDLAPAYDPAYIICDHVFAEGVVTEPTCTEEGYTSYACTLCEYVQKRDVVSAKGHSYVDGVCSVCGYVYVAESGTCGENLTWKFDQKTGTLTISGTGEMGNYDEFGTIPWYAWRTQLTSVVIEEGVTSVGGYAFFDHALMNSITLPNTLEKIGWYAFNCCDRLNTVEIPANVVQIHETAFTRTSRTRLLVYPGSAGEAYAIERGLKYTVLDVCSHTYDGVVTAPTCTAGGYTTYTCTACGDSYIADETAALGHTEEAIPGKAASCTEPGLTEGKKCSVCGEILTAQEEIAALGHTEEVIPGKAASCTEPGLTEGKKCSVCGEILTVQEEIAALGHREEVIPGKAASCTEPGLTEGKKCSVCGEILAAQEEIAALGHTAQILPGKAATCTETGLTEGKKCSVCGEILAAQEEIAKLAHTEVTIPGKPATETETGLTEGKKCSVCGEILTPQTVIDKLEPEKPCEGGESCPAHGFEDVDTSQWYHEAVDYVVEAGLMNGTDKGFEPAAATTRAQLATMLWRLAGEPTGNADTKFTDLDKDQQWYQEAVKWAFAKRIITGRSETVFDPNANVTRQEMVTMFYRFAKAMEIDLSAEGELGAFVDEKEVAEYAVAPMTWAVGAGLIKGNEVGGTVMLDAAGITNRAQMATVLMRYIEEIAK